MIAHECPKCANIFEAEKSPTRVPRKCPKCGAHRAHPVQPKRAKGSLPTGVVGFATFMFCFLTCAVAPFIRSLTGFSLVAVLVMYIVALPLSMHGMISSKESTVSRVFGSIGFGLILILTVVEIVLRMQR
ncbi:MAG: hypothetical protein QGH94_07685 [Phycisphaerae bacterium]|nr:hypothetical protein [Phycisphaerae bacterium]